MLENVKGLKTHDNGKTFNVIIGTLQNLGYVVFHEVLNARDFGLPQHRERLYIVALNNRKFKGVRFTFPLPPKTETRVGMILQKKVSPEYTLSDTLWKGHIRRKLKQTKKGNGFGYRLFTPLSKYTSTLTARYYKDGSEILIKQRNLNPRKITPREAARLQGFPDTFIIPVSDTQAYKQFGNAVAIPVIQALCREMTKLFSAHS